MTIDKTHKCTKCNTLLEYTNTGSWYNARKRRERQGFLHCKDCKKVHASKANKGNPKITGRPKGSPNRPDYVPWNKGKSDNVNNIGWHNYETRMLQIARRNGYNTYEEYRESLPEWKKYKIDVWRVTKQQPLHLLENFHLRGVNGEEGAYTLDHMVSIKKGFMQNISPEKVGHIDNLQMLPWEENITKGWK